MQVDEAETKADLVKLMKAVHEDSKKCIEQLQSALTTNDLQNAKEQLIVLRYLLSLENSIKDKGDRIGIIL